MKVVYLMETALAREILEHRCCCQREIDSKLSCLAGIGGFPNGYAALPGADIDQVIAL